MLAASNNNYNVVRVVEINGGEVLKMTSDQWERLKQTVKCPWQVVALRTQSTDKEDCKQGNKVIETLIED